MADVKQVSGKGERAGQRVSEGTRDRGTMGTRERVNKARHRGSKGKARREDGGTEPRKGKVKGYGVDRLRTAAERKMAGSSEALAETLMDNALKGKLESVKILMKLAEEEKARREEVRVEDTPGLADLLIGSVVKIGQMWDGHKWRRVAKSRILEEGCAKWEDIVGKHRDPVRMNEDLDRDDLEEAA
jgi:hypothetical protein